MEEKSLVQQISSPLYEAKGWLKLIGIFSIISGVGLIFTIFGILFCWIFIWMGVLLLGVASRIEQARASGDYAAMMESMNKLKTYFIINGVFTLLSILGIVLSIIFMGSALLTGLNSIDF